MNAAAPGALALEVLSGIHSGIRAPIEGTACAIGSATGCDVVLVDEGIAPEHLRLRFYGRLVAIDAVGGVVTIEGRSVLGHGYGCKVNLPVTLGVGETRLRIGRGSGQTRALPRWAIYTGGALALVAVALLAFQTGFSQLMPRQAMAHGEPAPALLTPASTKPETAEPATAAFSDERVTNALLQELEKADLATLKLDADGRRIVVSGEIPAQRMADWGKIQRSFDRMHGGRYILTSLVNAAAVANAPSFTFQAVWFGKNPYVIDARGERRYPGAAFQDGWMLKSIEPGAVSVVRGNEEFKLTL
ncbi:EscD/YscD/HrpQ family type III secretion system periplasmic domain-containing protein [Brucella sp. BE17]|uniref:SctD/MshK family protein n=1 Tax=Brucella sp. BE17 TaxID=3142977 RepID=UPI0031BABB53